MNGENRAPFEPPGLPRRRGLEWLPVPAKPDLDDAVVAQALVYSARDRFDLRQLGHRSILMENSVFEESSHASTSSARSAIRLASKLTTFHVPCLSRT